jgi:hypothetical protein
MDRPLIVHPQRTMFFRRQQFSNRDAGVISGRRSAAQDAAMPSRSLVIALALRLIVTGIAAAAIAPAFGAVAAS